MKQHYLFTTENIISFSQVKTYRVATERQDLNALSALITQSYPGLLVFLVNNELRISSRNLKLLARFIQEQKHYALTEVRPSFEEVFIGLMQ